MKIVVSKPIFMNVVYCPSCGEAAGRYSILVEVNGGPDGVSEMSRCGWCGWVDIP